MSFIKKENLVIVIGQYTDQMGQQKNEYKTIGELVTMQGNDGPYQFFKLWGAGGVTEGKVFEAKKASDLAPQQPQQQQQYVQPNGQPMNPQQVQQAQRAPDVPF
jgi:single-stranded DNA-binding protein